MKKRTDLTSGSITAKLIKRSFPIIGTSFIQMAYNLTDVIWLGRTGSTTITAATTAGFFMWLLMSFFYTTKSGTETLVAQSVGKKDFSTARHAAENALTIGLSASFIINFLIIVFAAGLLKFFKLKSSNSVLPRLRVFVPVKIKIIKKLLRIGVPVAIGHMSFCIFSMWIARIVSAYGTIPLGVQNVGASIEALSWNTALGFSAALAAFTGQNYGAKKHDRIRQGYYIILYIHMTGSGGASV
ncbi:MAG: hypothetical protein L3J56_03860 [Bacteroidales bacterium]|nr:hypothetical protein [Bacteroidales bacterium]